MRWQLYWGFYAKLSRIVDVLGDQLLRPGVYLVFAVLMAAILPLPVPGLVAGLLVAAPAFLAWLWLARGWIRRGRDGGRLP